MTALSMRTFREYNYENNKALVAWLSQNYEQVSPNKFISVSGGSGEFSRKELITRAAIEKIVARQWATLEISRLSLTDSNF